MKKNWNLLINDHEHDDLKIKKKCKKHWYNAVRNVRWNSEHLPILNLNIQPTVTVYAILMS